MPVAKRGPERPAVQTVEPRRPGTEKRAPVKTVWEEPMTRRKFSQKAAILVAGATLGGPLLALLAQRLRTRPSESIPIHGDEKPLFPNAGLKVPQPLPVERPKVELATAQVREKVQLVASREPIRFEVSRPEVILETAPLNQAPVDIKQHTKEELRVVPSAEEIKVRVPNLVTAIFEGNAPTVESEAAWLHQNAPVQTEILAVDIFSTANKIAETVPASLIANMAQAIIALEPEHIKETLPQLTNLLERASISEIVRKAQQQANRQATQQAIQDVNPESKPVNIPQGEVSPEGVHLEIPTEVAENLAQDTTEGEKWLPGPVALPALCIGWFGRDWIDALTSEFRAFLGLTDLGEATWRVTDAGTMADLLPAVLRGGRLESFANRLPYVKLDQESGALVGIKIPVYMANFADFRERDLFRVTTVGEYALKRLFG